VNELLPFKELRDARAVSRPRALSWDGYSFFFLPPSTASRK
jgi:hypothetical protein